ncbi:MAG: F0F1 ATP synthase subunit A [Planctomycetota bacterium]
MIGSELLSVLPTLAAEKGEIDPLGHVLNHPWIVSSDGWWLWTGFQGNLVLSAIITCGLGVWVANQVKTGPESEGHDRYVTRNPFAHMIEVIAVYLRDSVVEPLLHERTAKFMPFLWTLFFFILVNNMLGLVPLLDLYHFFDSDAKANHMSPIGGTATQHIWVTAMLAFVSFLVINLAGIRSLGIGGYASHLTAGAPPYVWPLMIPIEILGTFIKPIALAIRLFANMTAGHILLATLFLFAGQGLYVGLAGVAVTPISFLGSIAIYFLEIFVGFLQAFVFMFLTTVFISQLSHHGEHEDEHDTAEDKYHAEHGDDVTAEPQAALAT